MSCSTPRIGCSPAPACAEGDEFGNDDDFPLIGYEVDGAAFRRKDGRAVVTGEMGTPRDFVILGIAELGEGWVAGKANAAATMGLYVSPQGGVVFQGGDDRLADPGAAQHACRTITRNIVDRLRLPSARIIGPLPHRAGRMLAAVGETVSFHVDTGRFGDAARRCAANGRSPVRTSLESDGPLLRVQMPACSGLRHDQRDAVARCRGDWRSAHARCCH